MEPQKAGKMRGLYFLIWIQPPPTFLLIQNISLRVKSNRGGLAKMEFNNGFYCRTCTTALRPSLMYWFANIPLY